MLAEVRGKFDGISVIHATIFLFAVTGNPSWGYGPAVSINQEVQSMDQQQLQQEKLRQEILKLQLESEKLESRGQVVLSYAPFLTALIAAMGVFVTVWKQIYESRRQRELDRNQRSDERFTSIISNLGSESPPLQASAAVSIMTFLRPEYKDFHGQVFLILLANLKIQHSEAVKKLLITAFGLAARRYVGCARQEDSGVELDLSRSHLERVDLSGLDISHADIGFAQLHSANLTNAILHRVRGMKANLDKARLSRADLKLARFQEARFRGAQFHEAKMYGADLKKADLSGAQFQRAEMQSAQLDNAKLEGARFEQAILTDTSFKGARLDQKVLKSISNAKQWERAHFDPEIMTELGKIAKERG